MIVSEFLDVSKKKIKKIAPEIKKDNEEVEIFKKVIPFENHLFEKYFPDDYVPNLIEGIISY
jgi:hypothetical protein